MVKMMNDLSNEQLETLIPEFDKFDDKRMTNALRELLAYRETQGKPAVIVEESDYITVAQMTGKEPRRKAVRELYEGALIVGSKLYAAPHLPALPDVLEDGCGYKDSYIDGWNACRAAMSKAP